MKKIKSVKAISLGKVMGAMYVIIGLIIGGLITLFTVLGTSADGNGAGILFGAASIIIVPIIYGILGFVTGVLSGWIYNLVTKWIGCLEIELEDSDTEEEKE